MSNTILMPEDLRAKAGITSANQLSDAEYRTRMMRTAIDQFLTLDEDESVITKLDFAITKDERVTLNDMFETVTFGNGDGHLGLFLSDMSTSLKMTFLHAH